MTDEFVVVRNSRLNAQRKITLSWRQVYTHRIETTALRPLLQSHIKLGSHVYGIAGANSLGQESMRPATIEVVFVLVATLLAPSHKMEASFPFITVWINSRSALSIAEARVKNTRCKP